MFQRATKSDYVLFDDLYEECYLLLPYTYLVTCSDHTHHMHTDWLLDRRHCDSKWHSQVKAIQERVAQAQKTLPNTEQLAKITQTESRMSCDIRVCSHARHVTLEYASHTRHVTLEHMLCDYISYTPCYTGFRHEHAL